MQLLVALKLYGVGAIRKNSVAKDSSGNDNGGGGGEKLSRKVEANFIPRRHLKFISIPTQNFRCAMVYTIGARASLKKILQSILDH